MVYTEDKYPCNKDKNKWGNVSIGATMVKLTVYLYHGNISYKMMRIYNRNCYRQLSRWQTVSYK